mmetsp:Transcript_11643/g.27656  ORF Transcript_11643/g.27656 Transcript_11643/m.27656 type:complete len:747 (+) Transcript_11643:267-2507(+)
MPVTVAEQLPFGGPWGPAMDVIICVLPLVFLVLVTLVPRIRLPTSKSLPMASFLMWLFRLAYLTTDPNYTNAAVIFGTFDAFVPLSIIAGAILLFASMESTQCMPWIMIRLKSLSQGHPVAEVFLITWAFEYLVEGASGFGTPVALAAPMMGELGHNPFRTVVCALIMNTLATPFGGVGTPIWFGFSGLVPAEDEPAFFREVSWRTQLIMTVLSHVVPVMAASFLVPLAVLRRSWLFILLSVWSCALPALALSFVSYEFPSLLGGLIGVVCTGVLARFRVGLCADLREMDAMRAAHAREASEEHRSQRGAAKGSADAHGEGAGDGEPQMMDEAVGSFDLHDVFCVVSSDRPSPSLDFPNTIDPKGHPSSKNLRMGRSSAGVQAKPSPTPRDDRRQSDVGSTAARRPSSETHCDHHDDDHHDEEAGLVCRDGRFEPLELEGEKPGNGTDPSAEGNGRRHSEGKASGSGKAAGSSGHPTMGRLGTVVAGVGRTFPLWGTVVLLIITRVPALNVKPYLRLKAPYFEIDLNNLFQFRLSASLVFQFVNILAVDGLSWSYDLLYVPSLIPFILVSTIAVVAYRGDIARNRQSWKDPYRRTLSRVSYIMVPLIGALILVSLIRLSPADNQSPAYIVGYELSAALKEGWLAFIPFIGALGSFFSGSTTTSNLTFGKVNLIAAENLGLHPTALLAMQSVGATLGNAICINNIISAKVLAHVCDFVSCCKSEMDFCTCSVAWSICFFAFAQSPCL